MVAQTIGSNATGDDAALFEKLERPVGLAVDLASVPEDIRGYGHIKEANIEVAKAHEAQLLDAFRNPAKHVAATAPTATAAE